jgi:hypothetical protein
VTVEHAPASDRLYANRLLGFQVTGASSSVRAFYKPLRQAGAAARTMLVAAAAQSWRVDPASCRAWLPPSTRVVPLCGNRSGGIGLFVVGARRLEHLRYLAHDLLVAHLAGLARIPTDRTVVNWLRQ